MEKERRCRLCGSNKSVCFLHVLEKPNIREKIEKFLNIYVCADSIFSKVICADCCGQLERIDRYVRSCKVHQDELARQYFARPRTTETAVQTDDEVIVKNESHQATNDLKEELSDDEQNINNDVPLVYLSDDSDRECDSDVEFVTIEPFKFPMPIPATELDQKTILVSANEDPSSETIPEFKPELRNGCLVCDRNLQVGLSSFEEYNTTFEKVQREKPQMTPTEFQAKLKYKSKRGTAISANINRHKGCQIEITIGVHQSRQTRHSWSYDQKRRMQAFFKHHYTKYDVPAQEEIVKFLSKIKDDSFRGIDWSQIRKYFANRRWWNAYVHKTAKRK